MTNQVTSAPCPRFALPRSARCFIRSTGRHSRWAEPRVAMLRPACLHGAKYWHFSKTTIPDAALEESPKSHIEHETKGRIAVRNSAGSRSSQSKRQSQINGE